MNYVYITLSLSAICTLITFLGYLRFTRLDAMKTGSVSQDVFNINKAVNRIENQLHRMNDSVDAINCRLIKLETKMELECKGVS